MELFNLAREVEATDAAEEEVPGLLGWLMEEDE